MEKKSNKLITAILTIVLGVLFIALKGEVVSIAMTIFGVALIVLAILDLIHKQIAPCVVKAVVGIVVIVFGWTLVSAALYIMAALLLIYGILLLYQTIKNKTVYANTASKILKYAEPVVCIIVGLCLLFNQGGTIEWVFILSGIFFIVEGIIALVQYFKEIDK